MSQSKVATRPRRRGVSAAAPPPGLDAAIVAERASPAAKVDGSVFDFAAALTIDQMEKFERNAQDIGVSRRVTLMTLTKSKDEMVQIVRDMLADEESEGLVNGILASLDGWKTHLRDCLDLAESAEARMVCAIDTWDAGDL